MSTDPIRGKTIRWTYVDGPMTDKAFEHTFGADGTVTWRGLGEKGTGRQPDGKPPRARYEVARVNDDVHVVAYLAESGYTLTSVLDFAAGTVVSFASNEKELVVQHGTFEVAAPVR
jgi:hypothetical protein